MFCNQQSYFPLINLSLLQWPGLIRPSPTYDTLQDMLQYTPPLRHVPGVGPACHSLISPLCFSAEMKLQTERHGWVKLSWRELLQLV